MRSTRVPYEFWRVLHAEYGIVVYPSALTEEIDTHGLGVDVAYADAYGGHIGKSWVPLEDVHRLADVGVEYDS